LGLQQLTPPEQSPKSPATRTDSLAICHQPSLKIVSLNTYPGKNIRGEFSMSDLSEWLSEKQGYQSGSVRGPMFWFSKDGVGINDLWARYLSTA
jgi:hypothetical protein